MPTKEFIRANAAHFYNTWAERGASLILYHTRKASRYRLFSKIVNAKIIFQKQFSKDVGSFKVVVVLGWKQYYCERHNKRERERRSNLSLNHHTNVHIFDKESVRTACLQPLFVVNAEKRISKCIYTLERTRKYSPFSVAKSRVYVLACRYTKHLTWRCYRCYRLFNNKCSDTTLPLKKRVNSSFNRQSQFAVTEEAGRSSINNLMHCIIALS